MNHTKKNWKVFGNLYKSDAGQFPAFHNSPTMATYGDSGRPNYSENFTPTTQNLKYEWRIKNAKDRSEAWQIKQLKTYRAGIEELEQ